MKRWTRQDFLENKRSPPWGYLLRSENRSGDVPHVTMLAGNCQCECFWQRQRRKDEVKSLQKKKSSDTPSQLGSPGQRVRKGMKQRIRKQKERATRGRLSRLPAEWLGSATKSTPNFCRDAKMQSHYSQKSRRTRYGSETNRRICSGRKEKSGERVRLSAPRESELVAFRSGEMGISEAPAGD